MQSMMKRQAINSFYNFLFLFFFLFIYILSTKYFFFFNLAVLWQSDVIGAFSVWLINNY